MKGERNSTIAEKFRAKATPEEIAERNAQAVADRERLREEQRERRDAQRR